MKVTEIPTLDLFKFKELCYTNFNFSKTGKPVSSNKDREKAKNKWYKIYLIIEKELDNRLENITE